MKTPRRAAAAKETFRRYHESRLAGNIEANVASRIVAAFVVRRCRDRVLRHTGFVHCARGIGRFGCPALWSIPNPQFTFAGQDRFTGKYCGGGRWPMPGDRFALARRVRRYAHRRAGRPHPNLERGIDDNAFYQAHSRAECPVSNRFGPDGVCRRWSVGRSRHPRRRARSDWRRIRGPGLARGSVRCGRRPTRRCRLHHVVLTQVSIPLDRRVETSPGGRDAVLRRSSALRRTTSVALARP